MYFETDSRKAFELVAAAMGEIKSFQQRRDFSKLNLAKQKLSEALTVDPLFIDAQYYSGMVADLMGNPGDAVEQFEKVRGVNPPFLDQVEYNLGVAHYHLYHRPNLEKAIAHFTNVIRKTADPLLGVLASAGLAQTYGMMVLWKERFEYDYRHCLKFCDETENAIAELNAPPEDLLNEAIWTLCNAKAIATMYRTDHVVEPDVMEKLTQSIEWLMKANEVSPKNWAIYCNLGSLYMRAGFYSRVCKPVESKKFFDQALNYLNDVAINLRKDYGFAYYESGRVYRLSKEFQKSIECFNHALNIPEQNRNVSKNRLELEINRAEAQDASFP